MSKVISIGLIAIALILSTMTIAYSKLTVIPTVSIVEEYNDNIRLVESNEEDDFITIISPKIFLEYIPNKDVNLNLDYGFDFRFYSDNSDRNDTSIRETQRARLRAEIRPFNRFAIDVSDTYRRVPEDIREAYAPGNEFENMTDSNIFSISPYIEIPFASSLTSRVGYRYTNTWFKSDNGNNSDSNMIYTSLIKKFPAGLNLTLNYNYINYRPDLSDKYDGHQGMVSADYQIGRDLIVYGGIGYTSIDFSNNPNEESEIWNVGSQYKIDMFGGTILKASYSFFLSNSDLAIDALNYPETVVITDLETYMTQTYFIEDRDSISSGINETERVDIVISTQKYFAMTINPYYKEEDEIETNRVDKIMGVAVNIEKPLSTKLSASLDAQWERQKFYPDEVKVRRYILGGTFEYLLSRSILTSLGYKYNERDSDTTDDDFRNNIVWIGATITF